MEAQVTTKTKYKMNNGLEIPAIGFGTYHIRQRNDIEKSLKYAYESGYRLFDTAVMYGNEHLIGAAIKKLKLPRNEIMLTTKILPQDMTYNKAKLSIEKTLTDFKVDYIDIALIHWPHVQKVQDRLDVWKLLEEFVTQGKIKSIGVSNFLVEHLEHLINNCKIKPVLNQIECHPLYYDKETIDYCKANDILIEAYCPLAEFNSKLLQHSKIVKIAKDIGKSVPQVILKWHLMHNRIPDPVTMRKVSLSAMIK